MKKVLLSIGLVAIVASAAWRVNGFFAKSPVVFFHAISRLSSTQPLTIEPESKDRIVVKEAFEATNGYLLAHHYYYPAALHWEQAIKPYWNKNTPFSVALTGHRRLAMNIGLSAKQISSLDTNDNTVLFYETTSSLQNANGIPPHIPLHQASGKIPILVCVDGHSVNE